MEIKYFPFVGDDYKPSMGLKPLDPLEWIEIDDDYDRQLALKQVILRDHRDTALKVMPEADAGCLELREVLANHLASRYPEKFACKDGVLETRGVTFLPTLRGSEALEQISNWVQEDFAILSAKPPVKLIAGLVCFPSRWSLAYKIGQESDVIHAPVPQFHTIARPAAGFLERVSLDKPMWRLNWTIHDSDTLFCPGPHPGVEDICEADVLDRTWLRVERQTLRRLPKTGSVAFSIRTHIHPLRDVIADSNKRELLAASLRGLPHDSAEYKGMKRFHQLLTNVL